MSHPEQTETHQAERHPEETAARLQATLTQAAEIAASNPTPARAHLASQLEHEQARLEADL